MPSSLEQTRCVEGTVIQSRYRHLTNGLEAKAKTLAPCLETKTFGHWTQVPSRPETLLLLLFLRAGVQPTLDPYAEAFL